MAPPTSAGSASACSPSASTSRTRPTTPCPPRGLAGVYLGGLLVDLLNPKTVLFFVAVMPQFVDARAGSVRAQSALLGGCAVALAVLVDGGYALLAGRVVGRGISASAQRWGRRVSGGAFCALAALALLG